MQITKKVLAKTKISITAVNEVVLPLKSEDKSKNLQQTSFREVSDFSAKPVNSGTYGTQASPGLPPAQSSSIFGIFPEEFIPRSLIGWFDKRKMTCNQGEPRQSTTKEPDIQVSVKLSKL